MEHHGLIRYISFEHISGQRELIHVVPSKSDQVIRHFTLQVKRIEEAIQKVLRLEQVLVNILISTKFDQKREQIQGIYKLFKFSTNEQHNRNSSSQVNFIIQIIDELWDYYSQVNKRIQMLDKQKQVARQNIAILLVGEKEYGRSFFTNQRQRYQSYDKNNYYSVNKINYKAGVINKSNQLRFKRSVFRISKGNCLIMTKQLSDIFTDLEAKQKQRVVFFVIYPANTQNYFDTKLSKLISIFSDRIFDHLSQEIRSFDQILGQFRKSYSEATNLKEMCQFELDSFLYEKLLQKVNKKAIIFPQLKKYEFFKFYLLKERQIYLNLNEMDIFNHFFQAEVFIRKQDVKQVQQILSFPESSKQLPPGNIVPMVSKQKYPTSFILNDYTRPAQQIVETYGVPRYKEINPSIFTTVTFPFLFGVMFGDIGHGAILLAFGSWLVLKQNEITKLQNFMLDMVLPYRYLIALMGFFAVYCGFIYNDFLSISLNLFGSCFQIQNTKQTEIIHRTSTDCVYPIGLDPVWSVAQNSLNFTNSLKMKISVIIGVLHMILGVFLKLMNDLYYRNFKEIIFVFTSQLAFLVVLFGYMDFLIIYKWLVPWGSQKDSSMAPSIITQMINIPLSMGSTSGKPLWNQQSQQSLQYLLLIIAGISIPLMFFPVPLMKMFKIQKRNNKRQTGSPKKYKYSKASDMEMEIRQMLIEKQISIDLEDEPQKQAHQEEEETPSQILVHQAIQTIQFVLGCVSNTASYLRLWALSLAHSQLSEVFFEKTVQHSLKSGWSGIIMNIIGFSILASTTTGIMLLMDTMECFLHTLRLHWVQFQNKFYKGDGFSFKNYNFRKTINEELKQISF